MRSLTRSFLFLASIFLGAGSASAATINEEVGNFPVNACWSGSCSTQQKRVYDEFLQAGNIHWIPMPGVFSGVCYHRSPSHDSSVAHHAVAVLEREGESVFYNGRFTFFATENPYSGMTIDDARREGLDRRDSLHQLKLFEGHSFADFNPGGETKWRYYFRHAIDEQTLLVLGEWGNSHFLACELARNP